MMSLCKKTVHNLLGFPDPDDRCRSVPRRCRSISTSSGGAGLRCVAWTIPTPPAHVVESAALGLRPPLSTSSSSPSPSSPPPKQDVQQQRGERIDDGTRGLSYLYGRRSSLELCTESLGFESCCDGKMGAEEERTEQEIRRRIEEEAKKRSPAKRARLTKSAATEARQFPPPLTWLRGDGGRSSSFLKAVRKDGRFLLTEVRIERQEVLRASRQDGRLRLELVKQEPEVVEEEKIGEVEAAVAEEVPEVEEEAVIEEEEEEEKEVVEEEEEEDETEEVAVEEEEQPRWRLPSAAWDRKRESGRGGFWSGRCQEVVREGLPSSPFWGPRFVTTA